MRAADFAATLKRMNACGDAAKWAKGKTLAVAWRTCKRGDWMLWLAARANVDRKALVLAACACARLSLKHVKPGEDRPRIAIETAEAWARGEEGVTLEKVRAASYAAAAAYAAASYAAAAAYAAATAAYDARASTLAECAELVRKRIKAKDIEAALKEAA